MRLEHISVFLEVDDSVAPLRKIAAMCLLISHAISCFGNHDCIGVGCSSGILGGSSQYWLRCRFWSQTDQDPNPNSITMLLWTSYLISLGLVYHCILQRLSCPTKATDMRIQCTGLQNIFKIEHVPKQDLLFTTFNSILFTHKLTSNQLNKH